MRAGDAAHVLQDVQLVAVGLGEVVIEVGPRQDDGGGGHGRAAPGRVRKRGEGVGWGGWGGRKGCRV